MKIKEIREKSENELKKDLVERRNKLAKMRFDISAKQVKNHRDIRITKKDIARILTVLNISKVKTIL
ncbi:MAG TPA: 50S ribosomal protein L29 [Candidatus Saccharimonadales bacterium]|nr:50S ribosomal protein L29 [Candidatus Saccharimonadales bacterium]